MSRIAAVIASLALLLTPAPGSALFHLILIDELMVGVGADPTAQYVEIRMLAASQDLVAHTRLTHFSCDGSVVTVLINDLPNNICDAVAGHRWSMATASFAAASGVTPDFTFTAGAISATCGQICWGAPGVLLPPDPPLWDASDPNNYSDCVAYGAYTGPTKLGGTSTANPAGNGTMSLTRDPGDITFSLVTPTPTHSTPCPPTTTTTTTSTTTTTLVSPTQTLSGKKLLLKVKPPDATKSRIVGLSKDATITLGANGGAGDPTLAGGSLRVVSTAGDVFDDTYPLPAANWHIIGGGTGYKYTDPTQASGPIKVVIVKAGKLVKVVGKGSALGHSLAANPNPVGVVLTTGTIKYCASYGGTVTFIANTKYLAKDALAPGACPP